MNGLLALLAPNMLATTSSAARIGCDRVWHRGIRGRWCFQPRPTLPALQYREADVFRLITLPARLPSLARRKHEALLMLQGPELAYMFEMVETAVLARAPPYPQMELCSVGVGCPSGGYTYGSAATCHSRQSTGQKRLSVCPPQSKWHPGIILFCCYAALSQDTGRDREDRRP